MGWNEDLRKSMNVFDKIIRPVLPQLVTGEYIQVEGRDEEIAKILDENVGIDVMVNKGDSIFGLGSRIQIDSGVWNTFTIRCGRQSGHITELEKLRNAIKNDSMRPQLTMQAYVVNGELKSIAIAKTRDIIDYLDKHQDECPTRKSFDGKGYADFKVIHWDKMKEAEYKVNIIDYTK